ncbi:hypothetical protein OG884_22720 [Streptosporangium sp. NBC_01755]|nr:MULTISPECIES: hypothetical protein [unclassified Streptosporangium]WSA24221.1 hypothetical protein OIE13_25195 [Streptosporangium sp. NBC_01810]WSC97703.1 hypothetical protein OG884_22720 [Streptosporangium sp. NBC_01755]
MGEIVVTGGGTGIVRFVAAPEARHLTGQVLHVNGGAYPGR